MKNNIKKIKITTKLFYGSFVLLIILAMANVVYADGFISSGIIYNKENTNLGPLDSNTIPFADTTAIPNYVTESIDITSTLPENIMSGAYKVEGPTSYSSLAPIQSQNIIANESVYSNANLPNGFSSNGFPNTGFPANTGYGNSTYFVKDEPAEKAPAISAPAYILVNATKNTYYAEKNMNATYDPAGLANLMTAYLAYTEKGIDTALTVNKSAVKGIDKDAAIAALDEGDYITVHDAIASLFVKGCVDVANVIAENVSGSNEEFVKLMNETAKSFGCLNTTFTNPSGINDNNQLTTAYDMALIMSNVLKIPEIKDLLGITKFRLPASRRRGQLMLYSKTTVLSNESPNYNKDIEACRMGFNSNSRYTIASSTTVNGNVLVAVILKANGTQFGDTKKLIDYGKSLLTN